MHSLLFSSRIRRWLTRVFIPLSPMCASLSLSFFPFENRNDAINGGAILSIIERRIGRWGGGMISNRWCKFWLAWVEGKGKTVDCHAIYVSYPCLNINFQRAIWRNLNRAFIVARELQDGRDTLVGIDSG